MKKICILLLLAVSLWACKANKEEELEINIAHQDSVKQFTKSTKSYYYEPLGDTIYVDYEYRLHSKYEDYERKEEVKSENYFIISSFTSYHNDNKLQEELKRWKELEPTSYLESYGTDGSKKYFISLAKYKTRDELIPVWKELTNKYPKENINFYSIRQ